jgi:hypothetical protein
MHRVNPTSCKLLQKKWRQKDLALHQDRLKKIKPAVDLQPPSSINYLRGKAKKE